MSSTSSKVERLDDGLVADSDVRALKGGSVWLLGLSASRVWSRVGGFFTKRPKPSLVCS